MRYLLQYLKKISKMLVANCGNAGVNNFFKLVLLVVWHLEFNSSFFDKFQKYDDLMSIANNFCQGI
jgi:hypothetical protein